MCFKQRWREAGALVAGGLGRELVEGVLGVDRVPVDDRVGDKAQAVRLGGLALEGVQPDGAVVAVEDAVVQGVQALALVVLAADRAALGLVGEVAKHEPRLDEPPVLLRPAGAARLGGRMRGTPAFRATRQRRNRPPYLPTPQRPSSAHGDPQVDARTTAEPACHRPIPSAQRRSLSANPNANACRRHRRCTR